MSKSTSLLVAVGAATLVLSGCGGGGGDAPVVPDTVPASATASPEAFTQYVAMQPEDDQREPLRLDGLVPPTSETDEPVPVTR